MNKRNPGLGAMIRTHRLAKGFSQADLAKRLTNSTSMFISLLELNKSKVPPVLWGQLIFHLEMPEKVVVNKLVEHFRRYVENEISTGKKEALRRQPAKGLKSRTPARN